MSKLISIYKRLKQEDSSTIYLFKSGIFYIFIGEDAKNISDKLNLKLTNLNDNFVKCGFPVSSIDKYFNLLNNISCKIKIIDTQDFSTMNFQDYKISKVAQDLITSIQNININTLAVSEAYQFIEEIQRKANEIKF